MPAKEKTCWKNNNERAREKRTAKFNKTYWWEGTQRVRNTKRAHESCSGDFIWRGKTRAATERKGELLARICLRKKERYGWRKTDVCLVLLRTFNHSQGRILIILSCLCGLGNCDCSSQLEGSRLKFLSLFYWKFKMKSVPYHIDFEVRGRACLFNQCHSSYLVFKVSSCLFVSLTDYKNKRCYSNIFTKSLHFHL